jgi:hypothetical protein
MRNPDQPLTNNEVFALRDRASARRARRLVQVIDQYLETQEEGVRLAVLRALADEDRPSVLSLRYPAGVWKTYELDTADDVELIRGGRPTRAIYCRGIYSVEDSKHLPLIEQRLREVLEPMRAHGCQVEWYLDRA